MARDPPQTVRVPETVRGDTVLVTGGAGFVGSHLASTLAGTCDVRVIDDLSASQREALPDGITFLQGDIRDEPAITAAANGVDTIFHQAGLVSVPTSVDHPLESHSRNVDGTLAVLEAARENDARVVFASSAAVYGPPTQVPVTESEPTQPTSPYGVDKLAADHYTRLYHDRYDVETVTLRYFNVYGPGQQGGVIDVFRELLETGQPLTIEGDGGQTRDFIHITDVVRANLAAAATDELGRAYNIGTGEPISIETLAETMRSLSGSEVSIHHTPSRTEDIRESCADPTLAREELGFDAEIGLEEGLADLLGTERLSTHLSE